jgi:ribosome-associated protein
MSVPSTELRFRTSRSPGPGGQNVNKVETRVELVWSLDESGAFDDAAKKRIREALGRRVRADGTVRVSSSRHRTQTANRREAVARFEALIAAALRPRRKRKPTRPTEESVERRLDSKKRRARVKRLRGSLD